MNYQDYTVRDAAILTDSYVSGTVIGGNNNTGIDHLNFVGIEVDFTKGSLTSLEVKIEVSADNVKFARLTNVAVSAGTSTVTPREYTFTESGIYYITLETLKTRFVKVSVKGTGTVTSSSCAVKAVVGEV